MSQPLPGPMRPPTDQPKTNVLLYCTGAALVATFALATLTPDGWRLLAIPAGILAVLLAVAAVRVRVAALKSGTDQG